MPSPRVTLCLHRHLSVLDTAELLEFWVAMNAGWAQEIPENDYRKATIVMKNIGALYKQLNNINENKLQVQVQISPFILQQGFLH